MTPQERDVIAGIFDRLKQAANQPRDPEAERYIAERLREQPYAPYAMAQSVYVQEQALTNLQQQVEDLQTQMRECRADPRRLPPSPAASCRASSAAAPSRRGRARSRPSRSAGRVPPPQPGTISSPAPCREPPADNPAPLASSLAPGRTSRRSSRLPAAGVVI